MKFFKMAAAVDQHQGFKPFFRPPRCKLPSYSQLDYTMLESGHTNLKKSIHHAFEIASIHRSFSTPCLSISTRLEEAFDSNSRIEIVGGQGAPKVRALVVEVAIAMATGVNPEPVSTGLGGAYFLRARNGDTIAVAKPMDEEPLAINNPKGFAGQMLGQPGMKRSIRVGETGLRELAAYLLDHGGFAGVPPTALVKMLHIKFNINCSDQSMVAPPYKIASLQRFVEHDSDAGDLGPSGFSVGSVHRIGILDVRLLNLDRHAGNILVKKVPVGVAELVPIDHGFCLPESLDDPYFEWLHWPQASIPFSESEIEYISSLDPFKDAELLRTELPSIRESAIRIFVLCTIFLRQAADSGMCLADIGEMMTREFHGGEENRSALENVCMDAKAGLSSRMNEVFQVDDENKDSSNEVFQVDDENEDSSNEVSDNLQLLQSLDKPQKIQRLSSETSMMKFTDTLLFAFEEEESSQNGICDSNNIKEEVKKQDENGGDSCKAGGLMRSMSYAITNHSNDNGVISFGEMNNEEWEAFFEIFKKLLPELFEGRKSMCLSKKRLGNSCQF